MYVVESYPLAVILCIVTMLCWGSWANTQKLASKSWSFPLFYWDYVFGLLIVSFLFGITLGSSGDQGQSFFPNLAQADSGAIGSALLGGIVFNLANLLIVAAIEVAGMAIAFPIGIGLALVIGVVINYLATPVGNPYLLFFGVALVCLAIIFDAAAYRRISDRRTSSKGILLSLVGGILMGFFFRFVAASMAEDYLQPASGLLTPYTAIFIFSVGVVLSNVIFNTFFMYRPVSGPPSTYADYVKNGSIGTHLIGLLGGLIWTFGMMFSLIASGTAGFAISYGLGQGATMIAAIWGVFIWKEFKGAPRGTSGLLALMFLCFVAGLVIIVYSRF